MRNDWKKTLFVSVAVALAVSAMWYVRALVVEGRSAGYNVILMNPNNPAQALGQWVTPTKPKVVVGGVEWTDAIGRYRMVSGTVYVEQILLAARPPAQAAVAQPTEQSDASQPEEPEVTDGD